jgi:hypothetical protein
VMKRSGSRRAPIPQRLYGKARPVHPRCVPARQAAGRSICRRRWRETLVVYHRRELASPTVHGDRVSPRT